MDSSVLNEHSELMLVNYNDGVLVSDPLHPDVSELHRPLKDAIHFFRQAVNFNKPWSPGKAEKAFQNIKKTSKGGLITAYPIPVVPEAYDDSYEPRFMVVHSISLGVFGVVNDISDSIHYGVQEICILAGALAVFGMMLVLAIVWCVSHMLTEPLLWMKAVAWRIVNHAEGDTGDALKVAEEEVKPAATFHCAPNTEINKLVTEFQIMIKGFSGEGAAKVADSALHEVQNDLTWHSDFQQLYFSRQQQRTISVAVDVSEASDEESSSSPSKKQCGILQRPLTETLKIESEDAQPLIVPPPIKRNHSNVICMPVEAGKEGQCIAASAPAKIHQSALFWWIVVLIVIPLLLVMGVICATVSHHIVSQIPSWVKNAGDASHSLAMDALNLTAASKASLMSAVVFEGVRDLHLMTRIAGWLYFGGISRSSAFTAMDTATEQCKVYPKGECPYYLSNRTPCPCDWKDLIVDNCTEYNFTESRALQRQHWSLQAQDADPVTGSHNHSTSFPPVGSSPERTLWWANVSSLPGAEKGMQAAGYATSYDRLRVVSAMSVALFPVYNYAQHLKRKNRILGVYIAFELDGLFTGFKGCRYDHADYPFWNSTEENLAAALAPSLCPIGKYGYDPRCRNWYATGKEQYMLSNVPVYIAPPYEFATGGFIATSATAPIAHPETKEYVGQTLIDFYPEGVTQALEGLGALFPILVTPEADASGGDTVIGPSKSSDWESASILDLLFAYDGEGTQNRAHFEQCCLSPMKNGTSGLKEFSRHQQDGTFEHLIIAFAPVYERVVLPISPDDFSRGVNISKVLLYSVGIVRHSEDMRAPFQEIEGDIKSQLDNIKTIYIVLTAIVAVLFTAFACIVSMSILFLSKPTPLCPLTLL